MSAPAILPRLGIDGNGLIGAMSGIIGVLPADRRAQGNTMRTLWAFICALLAAHIVGTTASAAPHLSWLASQGMDITMSVRMDAYLQAITGMYLYMALAGVALLVGFYVATLITNRLPSLTSLGYPLAGFCAMIALMLALNAFAEIAAIPSTRTIGGLLAQGAAGAIGGFVFKLMKTKPQAS